MLPTTFRRAIVAVLALPATLFAQTKFEGAVTMAISSPQGSQEITYLIKGDKARIDMPATGGMSGYMIRDAATDVMSMVMPAQKMYMDFKDMQGMMANAQQNAKKPDIKMTGNKETIAGHECEHVIITDDQGAFDVCGAKGFGAFMMSSGPMGRGSAGGPPSGLERLGSDFFPLKVQKVGGREVVLQVTKIEKKPLDASLFTVPSDFQKMQLPGRGRP